MTRPPRLHNRRAMLLWRRTLRSHLTPAEAALWRLLQRSQLDGRKFRRQHSIGPYIIDFYCPAEQLAIELDGSAHERLVSVTRDETRDRFLVSAGIRTLRVENRHVFENPQGVLEWIRQQFTSNSPHHPARSAGTPPR